MNIEILAYELQVYVSSASHIVPSELRLRVHADFWILNRIHNESILLGSTWERSQSATYFRLEDNARDPLVKFLLAQNSLEATIDNLIIISYESSLSFLKYANWIFIQSNTSGSICNRLVPSKTPPPKHSRLEKKFLCLGLPSLFLNHFPSFIGINPRKIETPPKRTITLILLAIQQLISIFVESYPLVLLSFICYVKFNN